MAFQLLPFIAKALLGGAASSASSGWFGGSGQNPNTTGIQSGLHNVTPPPVQSNPVGGSLWSKLGDNLTDGLSSGLSSALLRGFGLAAGSRQGEMNRASLDAAFPELNPWEKAGVSATGPGIQGSAQDLQRNAQTREFRQQSEMQDKNIALEKLRLQTQERMNSISAAAGITSAGISSAPAAAMVPYNQDLTSYQLDKLHAETAEVRDRNNRAWVSDLATAIKSKDASMMSDRQPWSNIGSVMARDLMGMATGFLRRGRTGGAVSGPPGRSVLPVNAVRREPKVSYNSKPRGTNPDDWPLID